MSENREIEAKVLLSQVNYQRIQQTFPLKARFRQQNFYFETPNKRLKQAKTSLRIRCYEDRGECTLKVPEQQQWQQRFHESRELNADLTLAEAHALLAAAKAGNTITFPGIVGQYLAAHYPDAPLKLVTWSKTDRSLLSGPDQVELTLDDTSYPDGYRDYELEIENHVPAVIAKVQAELTATFKLTITATNRNQSKIGRAFKHQRAL